MAQVDRHVSAAADEQLLRECRGYYERYVQMDRDRVRESVQRVTSVVNDMFQYVHDEDGRFERNPVTAGSYRQRLKVSKPDEFDFNVKLSVNTSSWCWSSLAHRRCYGFDKLAEDPVATMDNAMRVVVTGAEQPPPGIGYVDVNANCVLGQDATWPEMCFGGSVIPFLVRKRLRQLMVDAHQKKPELQGKVSLSRKLAGPALSFRMDGAEKEREISVDLSPFFDVPHLWPSDSDWPRPRTSVWLSAEKRSKVKARGCQLVPKKNFDWLVSYAQAETELLDDIDADGGCRRQCLRLLKHLNSKFFSKTPKPAVSSYVLKNIWLRECEELPESGHWAKDMLWLRLRGLVDRLRSCLYGREAPLYFNSRVNMLLHKEKEEMEIVKEILDNFLRDPLRWLKK